MEKHRRNGKKIMELIRKAIDDSEEITEACREASGDEGFLILIDISVEIGIAEPKAESAAQKEPFTVRDMKFLAALNIADSVDSDTV